MKKCLILAAAAFLAACTGKKSDIEVITSFYEAVLGEKEMTDALLHQSLSEEILDSIWETEYEDTFTYWVFRTGRQDGPLRESSLEGIEPLGDGWYRVSYLDMGIPGETCVKMENGRITDYRPEGPQD